MLIFTILTVALALVADASLQKDLKKSLLYELGLSKVPHTDDPWVSIEDFHDGLLEEQVIRVEAVHRHRFFDDIAILTLDYDEEEEGAEVVVSNRPLSESDVYSVYEHMLGADTRSARDEVDFAFDEPLAIGPAVNTALAFLEERIDRDPVLAERVRVEADRMMSSADDQEAREGQLLSLWMALSDAVSATRSSYTLTPFQPPPPSLHLEDLWEAFDACRTAWLAHNGHGWSDLEKDLGFTPRYAYRIGRARLYVVLYGDFVTSVHRSRRQAEEAARYMIDHEEPQHEIHVGNTGWLSQVRIAEILQNGEMGYEFSESVDDAEEIYNPYEEDPAQLITLQNEVGIREGTLWHWPTDSDTLQVAHEGRSGVKPWLFQDLEDARRFALAAGLPLIARVEVQGYISATNLMDFNHNQLRIWVNALNAQDNTDIESLEDLERHTSNWTQALQLGQAPNPASTVEYQEDLPIEPFFEADDVVLWILSGAFFSPSGYSPAHLRILDAEVVEGLPLGRR